MRRSKKSLAIPVNLPEGTAVGVDGQVVGKISDEDRKLYNSIVTMEHVLYQVLDIQFGASPGQLGDAAEMFIVVMHLKKVAPEFFCENINVAVEMASKARAIKSEVRLQMIEGLSPEAVATLKAAADVSVQEINQLRNKLMAAVEAMHQIPMPWVPIH